PRALRAGGHRRHPGAGAGLAGPARRPADRDGAPPGPGGRAAGPGRRVPGRRGVARPGRPGPDPGGAGVTRILPALGAPDPAVGAGAAAVPRAADRLVLPPDTVYGLACAPAVDGATARLFAAKGRGENVPVAVLCAHADQALALADPDRLAGDVRRLAER